MAIINQCERMDFYSELDNFFLEDLKQLKYEVHCFSTYCTNFVPENILVDCPQDQTSRWSANTNIPPQFLTLKLRRPAIVRKIKFGKYEKPHVCNIKKFRVLGGLNEEHMTLLLENGLKNDNIPETFDLRYTMKEGTEKLPILYLQIVPIQTWGPTFNFSIWYVELLGQDDPMYTKSFLQDYNRLREIELVKLCLKHFRQQGYIDAYEALQRETEINLEHETVDELYRTLVLEGNIAKTESLLEDYMKGSIVDSYLNNQEYKHSWCIQHHDKKEQPGNRGGHQLVVDNTKRLIYLYGGWDGFRDLSDLWVFSIENKSWTLLNENSELCNGPTPRSCHKMVFDPVSESIFMIGRYLDQNNRHETNVKSDFYLYNISSKNWLLICDDTKEVGGPPLIYDHQMCMDVKKGVIYVFGGKILNKIRSPRKSEIEHEIPEYSGLFSYHIATNTWMETIKGIVDQYDAFPLQPRATHCMVFHHKQRRLYIYGGQRGKEDIDEFLSYDVDINKVHLLEKNPAYKKNNNDNNNDLRNEPAPGHALRASIDCEKDEIYIFSSLSKLKGNREPQRVDASNSLWVYSLKSRKWSRIYTYRHNSKAQSKNVLEPCPRYAHQLVYDDVAKVHYLFGGNPGRPKLPQLRLNDFWMLILERPNRKDIFRQCQFMLRQLHFEELSHFDTFAALQYLRENIAEVVDHANEEELKSFHRLAAIIFKEDSSVFEKSTVKTTPYLVFNGNMKSMISNGASNNTNGETSKDNGQENATHFDEVEQMNNSTHLLHSSSSCGHNSSRSSDFMNSSFYERYCVAGGKRSRNDYMRDLKARRMVLFSKLIEIFPPEMVQPVNNLSDFIFL